MKKRQCNHQAFIALCSELEATGRKFTREEMGKLCYSNLTLAVIGNAGKAAGKSGDAFAEELTRLAVYSEMTPEELAEAEFCDDHEQHAAFDQAAERRGALPDAKADPEILLYRNMKRLRGNWSGGRGSFYLEEIYRLLPICEERGVLPSGWLKAVEHNADTFDGHFDDGRIMRDGQYAMPEEIVEALGLPQEMAQGVSGNLAKMLGAQPISDRFRGSYEELLDSVLTPVQRIEFQRRCAEEDE